MDELQRQVRVAHERIVRLERETNEAIAQQTAVSDVLKAMSRSPYALDVLLQATVDHGTALCKAKNGLIYLLVDGELRLRTDSQDAPPEAKVYELAHPTPIDRGTAVGRAVVEGRTVQITDVLADPEYRWDIQEVIGFRTLLAVPIRRANEILGVIAFSRHEVSPFSPAEIALVETFADQAAIAIENVRLFNGSRAISGRAARSRSRSPSRHGPAGCRPKRRADLCSRAMALNHIDFRARPPRP